MLAVLAIALFAGLLIYAAFSDVASLTIPNWVSLAMAGAFAPLALVAGVELGDLGMHYLFGLCALAVGFFLFQARIIGGGDAKLLAAAGIWTGFAAFMPFLFWTAVAGGVMSLALLGARRFVVANETQPAFVNRLLTPSSGVPYGVAIMVGGLMAIPGLPFA
jgi:prepilin peptidase CpaA